MENNQIITVLPEGDMAVIADASECKCGQTKCVDGVLWRCIRLNFETCVWEITDELCNASKS